MIMLVRLVQLTKAQPPMLVTLLGIVMLLNLLQLTKAYSPIVVTLSGMIILVRLLQSLNASEPIFVTSLPSIVDGIISSPDAEASQSVIVIEFPSSV